ncbi:Alpha/beta hydrolase fold-1 [Astrocystis sublimbata]|nr:Alpha/beta hydrolase fold-1 [Astrocystis sublimbata]
MASSTKSKPTLVIVHGGGHVPASYEKMRAQLVSQGYEVHIPRLPSTNGMRPPNADLYSDSNLVRSYVESLVEAGRDVVAILHSYGGQVGTNALYGLGAQARQQQGLPGGISHLIYMTAYAVPEGNAMMNIVKRMNNMDLVPLVFDFADDDTCLFHNPKGIMVGPVEDMDDAEVDAYLATFVRWNGKGMYQPIEHAAWRDIPTSYVYTTNDTSVPIHYQEDFVAGLEKEGVKVQTFKLATGHCPHFTATTDMVDIVNKVVGA